MELPCSAGNWGLSLQPTRDVLRADSRDTVPPRGRAPACGFAHDEERDPCVRDSGPAVVFRGATATAMSHEAASAGR
jgi:hypothetical protein